MFERFTDRARRVLVLAQEESRLLNHNYIGTEHLLLGLIHEGEGVAAKALESLSISLEAVRSQIEDIVGQGGGPPPGGHIPFTPRAKRALELSLREALQLGHNYIGTEHILLGLIREDEGVAAQVLVMQGAELSRVRQHVLQLLSSYSEPPVDLTEDERAFDEALVRELRPDLGRSWAAGVAAFEGRPTAPFPAVPRSMEAMVIAGSLAILSVLVGLLAVIVDRPPTALARVALVLLIGGVAGWAVAGSAELLGRRRCGGPHGQWPLLAGISLFAGAAILLLLDAVIG